MTAGLRVANSHIHVLAESPFWDAARGRLLWVDIERGELFAGALDAEGAIDIVERISVQGRVGAVAPATDGGWIIAAGENLLLRAPGRMPRPWLRLLDSGGSRRLNDGKPDPSGRYLVGTLSLGGPSTAEQLFTLDAEADVRVLDDDLTQANGLAWSPDGQLLYTVDTLRRRVYARPYDHTSGACGRREVFIETAGDAFPDGLCVDADGNLWIAMWGAGEVRCYSTTGALLGAVPVPAPHTSSVAFAGALLDVLVVTTATHDMTQDQLAHFPDSGKIFTCRPGALGSPQSLWSGSTRPF